MSATETEFTPVYKATCVTISYNAELKTILCTATKEYIPFEEFKSAFTDVLQILDAQKSTHFIFDKRKLSTFHQPSMEWYFTTWKLEAAKFGLCNHIKILPDADWFAQAVNAGKHDIFEKHGTEFLSGITIEYAANIEEAVAKVTQLSESAG